MLMIIGIIVGIIALICFILGWYCYRRRRIPGAKANAIKEHASIGGGGEVIPEEGDPVEWGTSNYEYTLPEINKMYSINNSGEEDVHEKMRRGDLFVI